MKIMLLLTDLLTSFSPFFVILEGISHELCCRAECSACVRVLWVPRMTFREFSVVLKRRGSISGDKAWVVKPVAALWAREKYIYGHTEGGNISNMKCKLHQMGVQSEDREHMKTISGCVFFQGQSAVKAPLMKNKSVMWFVYLNLRGGSHNLMIQAATQCLTSPALCAGEITCQSLGSSTVRVALLGLKASVSQFWVLSNSGSECGLSN